MSPTTPWGMSSFAGRYGGRLLATRLRRQTTVRVPIDISTSRPVRTEISDLALLSEFVLFMPCRSPIELEFGAGSRLPNHKITLSERVKLQMVRCATAEDWGCTQDSSPASA